MTATWRRAARVGLFCTAIAALPARGFALERLCDTAYQDCRAPLLSLINNEKVGIDVAFWFMQDTKYRDAIIARWRAGVPVRILFDPRANSSYDTNAAIVQSFKEAGIPMRYKSGGGILHWKMMLFAGQNTVEFSGANFSPTAFAYGTPYADYVDEVIVFTDLPSRVNSFKTKYDDVWTATSGYRTYANVTLLQRYYPQYPLDPEMNFPPYESFRTRSVNGYRAETAGIDAIMYRITDRAHTDTLIAAVARGVPVRLITEQNQYRDATRLWDAWNVDRMYMNGVSVKFRGHKGLNHEKLTILHAQQMIVVGSSNWTSPSAAYQLEHNLFTTDGIMYAWSRDHFNRKWNNLGPSPETKAFAPLPPDTPVLKSPANGATGVSTTPTFTWYAGPWAHKYDVYVGTSTSSMTKILSDVELGPSENATDDVTWKSTTILKASTTYYWRVVGRTMANLSKTSATGYFKTGSSTSTTGPLPSGWSTRDIGSVAATGSASYSSGTFTVKGSGADIWGSADEFRFVYRTLTGDGSIVARVGSLTNTSSWAKAGVMMRETLTAGSKHAFMLVSAANGLAFQRRASTGGTSTHTSGGSGTAPYWVKVVRSGSTFSAYKSSTGSTWTLVGSQSITMASTIYVGLAVTSHSDGRLATGSFTNVN